MAARFKSTIGLIILIVIGIIGIFYFLVPSAEEDAAPADETDVFAVSAEPQPASRADAQKAAVKMLTIFFFIIIFSFFT